LFPDTPILNHFDLAKPITLLADRSGFPQAGIVSESDRFGFFWPVNIFTTKSTGEKDNDRTQNSKYFPIVETKKQL
jgi:hypothetical protein